MEEEGLKQLEVFTEHPGQAFVSELPKAHMLVGDIHVRHWRTEEALVAYKKALDTAGETITEPDFGFLAAERAIELLTKMGSNGSGYSEKKRSVCYGLVRTKNEEEEEEWKVDKLRTAIEFIKLALKRAPTDEKSGLIDTLGSTLTQLDDTDGAIVLYKEQIEQDPENAGLFYFKLALTLHEQGGHEEEAMENVKKAIEINPESASAWKLLAKLLPAGLDEATEAENRAKFLGWVPHFLSEELTWNQTNSIRVARVWTDVMGLLTEIEALTEEEKGAPEIVDLLGAIVYHHYHGPVDDTSARILGDLACKNNQRAADRLLSLIQNHQSVCTIRLALGGLSRAKDTRAFNLCSVLLPQDGQGFFPMDVAGSLEILDSPEAADLLVEFLKTSGAGVSEESEESSDDGFMMGVGKSMNVDRCLWALGHFAKTSEEAKAFLEKVLESNTDKLKSFAAAALFRSTRDIELVKKYIFSADRVDESALSRLENLIEESEELKAMVQEYRDKKNAEEEAEKIRNEIGIENWQPSEKQLETWNERNEVNMGSCLARQIPEDLPEKTPNITKLDLRNNRLTQIPSDLISRWPKLKIINFQANKLSGILPEGAFFHPELEELNFHGNSVESLPSDIDRLPELKKLSVTHNSLLSLPPSVALLTKLQEIDLDYNEGLSVLPDLSPLSLLTGLSLVHCDFHELPSFVPLLPCLKRLNVRQNKISVFPSLPQKLDFLSAGDNLLNFFPYRVWKNTASLHITENPFELVEESTEEVESLTLLEQALRKAYTEKSEVDALPEDLRSDLQTPSFCDFCDGPFFHYHVKCVIVAEKKDYDSVAKIPLHAKFCQVHPEAITAVKLKPRNKK
jgi:Leucine-rich repeat (LRR) protein